MNNQHPDFYKDWPEAKMRSELARLNTVLDEIGTLLNEALGESQERQTPENG